MPRDAFGENEMNDQANVLESNRQALARPVAQHTALIVVDVQERLSAAMPQQRLEELRRALRILLGAARELSIPTLYTEQYPKGLGPTNEELRRELENLGAARFEKNAFSACGADGFERALPADLRTAVVVGMETHVCVFQTVRDLTSRGIPVQVPLDGVVSRRDDHRDVGLRLCERAGAVITTSETLLFDMLGQAGTATFKALAPLVR